MRRADVPPSIRIGVVAVAQVVLDDKAVGVEPGVTAGFVGAEVGGGAMSLKF